MCKYLPSAAFPESGIRNRSDSGAPSTRDQPICFFGADADISAIHGPIADISKILKSCFLLHYQKYFTYSMPYFFFKNFKNQDSRAKIFKL